MAYDEGLAQRIRESLQNRGDVSEKKMFGGLCYMVSGHMCCGIVGDTLMARVGPKKYTQALSNQHAREMDFTGRALKGMVYVEPEGIESESSLSYWLSECLEFVDSLPPK